MVPVGGRLATLISISRMSKDLQQFFFGNLLLKTIGDPTPAGGWPGSGATRFGLPNPCGPAPEHGLKTTTPFNIYGELFGTRGCVNGSGNRPGVHSEPGKNRGLRPCESSRRTTPASPEPRIDPSDRQSKSFSAMPDFPQLSRRTVDSRHTRGLPLPTQAQVQGNQDARLA